MTYQDICQLDQLEDGKPHTKGAVTLVRNGEQVHACASRCPHMGYPMRKGTVRDGVITCAWHKWEFDLEHGGCYRGACDDLPIYPVRITDGTVQVALNSAAEAEQQRIASLHDALLTADMYLQAKALAKLQDHGWATDRIVQECLQAGFAHSVAAHQSRRAAEEALAIIDATQLSQAADSTRKLQALLQGIRQVGGPAGKRMQMSPLPTPVNNQDLLKRLQDYIDDPSSLGIERICLSLRHNGAAAATVWNALLSAACGPDFIDQGESFWAVVAARCCAEASDEPLAPESLAMAAWATGIQRRQPDAECIPALEWWEQHQDRIAQLATQERTNTQLTDADSEALTQACNGTEPAAPLDWMLNKLEKGHTIEALLECCIIIASRRLAALTPNNGGMWGSAVTSLQRCRALQRALHLVPGTYGSTALLHIVSDFFRARWLPSGSDIQAGEIPVDVHAAYVQAFAQGDTRLLHSCTLALLGSDKTVDQQAWLAPLIDEDLGPAHLELLYMCLDQRRAQASWQALACGVATWIMDGSGRQNVRPAARFGLSMLA